MGKTVFAVAAILMTLCLSGCSKRPERPEMSWKEVCLAKGGRETRQPSGNMLCRIPYPDGGKPCNSKADCRGLCMVNLEASKNKALTSGDAVRGQCQTETPLFGCYARVEGGKISGSTDCGD